MNLDFSPENQPKGTYRKALNVVSPLSGVGEISNEKGKIKLAELEADVLGNVFIPSKDINILFLANNSIVEFKNDKISLLIRDSSLNFKSNVFGDFYIKDNGEIIIIFWDGLNPIRNINISDINYCKAETLSFFNTLSHCPKIKELKVSNSGGIAVNTGSYQFWMRYKTKENKYSNCILIDNFIPVIADNGTKFDTITGNISKLTSSSIKIKLEETDLSYPFIEYGVIQTVDGVTTSKSLEVINNSSSVYLEYKGKTFNEYSIDLNEILTPFAFYTSAKYGMFYDNKLLLGGVQRRKNLNYQKYANEIKVSYITSKIDVSKTNGYKNPLHILHHKTWQRDEIYAGAIVWKYNDGTKSAPFHIPGPEVTNYDLDPVQSSDCCKDTNDFIPRWKAENTAKRTKINSQCNSLLEKENCNFTETNIPIRSEGKLAYWESCETYPLIKDDEGKYMYPTEKINNEIVGQKIRYWKMPDSNVEEFFENNNIRTGEVFNEWDNAFIYPLGIKLDNVHIPDDNDIVGYEIVYVKRDTFNKSILDKGLFIKTYKSDYNNRTYIYPKNCVNSARGLDVYTDTVGKTYVDNPAWTTNEKYLFRNTVKNSFLNNGDLQENDNGFVFYGANSLIKKEGMDLTHIKVEKQFSGNGHYFNQYNNDKDGRWREVETQIYSLLEQTPYKKKLCVDDWSYIKGDTLLNKGGNISHSIFNKFRESSLFVQTKGTDTLFLNYKGFNTKSDSSIPYGSEHYFKTQVHALGTKQFILPVVNVPYVDNFYLENEDRSLRQNYGMLHYGSLKREDCSLYGNVSSLQYISTGLQSCSLSSSIYGLYGDAYINMFSFHRTSVFMNDGMVLHPLGDNDKVYVEDRTVGVPNVDITIFKDPYVSYVPQAPSTFALFELAAPLNFIPKPHATLINTFIESDINLDLRIEEDTIYPSLKNKEKRVAVNNAEEFPEDSYLNNILYKIYCKTQLEDANCCNPNPYNGDCIRGLKDNVFKINYDFDRQNDVNKYIGINENYKTEKENVLDNIIAISDVHYNFKLNDFVNIPNRYGGITNLFQIGGSLYAHTTDNIFKINTQNSSLQTSDSNIYIGNGNILSSVPIPMFVSNEGMYGLNSTLDKFQNSSGYYFLDRKTKKFYHFNGQAGIKDLSLLGMNNFFNNSEYNSLNYSYDSVYNRLIIECDDFTLSYEPYKEAFRSFHDYKADWMLNDRMNFYSIKDREIFKHNQGEYMPFIIEGSEPFTQEAILNDVYFKTKVYKDNVELEETFTDMLLFNKRQTSGNLQLHQFDYKEMNDFVNNQKTHVNRHEQYWSVNEFSDKADSPHMSNELFQQPYVINKQWYETEAFRDDFIIIRFSYNKNNQFLTSFINANYTKI